MNRNRFSSCTFTVLLLGLVLFCWGCHPKVQDKAAGQPPLHKIKPGKYPGFLDSLDIEGLADAVDRSLVYFKRVPYNRQFSYGQDTFTAAHLMVSMETLKNFLETRPTASQLASFIRSKFWVYRAAGNQDKEVLFTGYFEPTYPGGRIQSDSCRYPLFSRPEDLYEIDLPLFSETYKGHRRLVARVSPETKRIVPYYTREQINTIGDFHERAVPIAWLENRVDRFFLEIQGSGRVDLKDGTVLRVHYAGSNGNAYRSVGRYLIDQGLIPKEQMSMQAIRTWLELNPQRMDEVLHYNESVIFFKEEEGGPYGSLGVEVTPFRSIATDSRLFPKGALCFIEAQLPDRVNVNPIKEWEPASFFALNQDTGGAIKGPARADIFCGNDPYAVYTAGHMKVYGRLYVMVLAP